MTYRMHVNKDSISDYVTMSPHTGAKPENVEPLLYNFLKMTSENVADSEFDLKHIPIRFLVSLRTDTTNQIVAPIKGNFYTDCTKSYSDEHLLDDLSILSARELVLSLFRNHDYLPVIIPRTAMYPIGACYIDGVVYVYSNVVIDHTLLEDPNVDFNDCELIDIKDLVRGTPLEESLINSLAIVGGE